MQRLRSLLRKREAPWLALLLVLLITWTASAAGSGTTLYLPYVSVYPTPTPTPPLPGYDSTSYYVQTASSQDAYNMGCLLGQIDLNLPGAQDRLVILDFGQPWYENNAYGTIIFRIGGVGDFTFASMDTITAMAKGWASGYWSCTGSDKASHLTLGIGTSNYLRADIANTTHAYQHGRLWAQMVLSVNSWLAEQGYAAQVYAAGANDMELSWATPALTRAWVDGFNAYDNGSAIYYNYGACEGCPQSYYSSYDQWVGYNGWTPADLWYISWGVQPAWVVPEIYLSTGANARQWQTLSKYAAVKKGLRIDFSGVLTQYGACQQRGGCVNEETGIDTMNTSQEGLNQLWTYTYNDIDTRMKGIRWATDIRYWVK